MGWRGAPRHEADAALGAARPAQAGAPASSRDLPPPRAGALVEIVRGWDNRQDPAPDCGCRSKGRPRDADDGPRDAGDPEPPAIRI